MAVRELDGGLLVQCAPDLFPGAMLAEPQVSDPHHDVQPVPRAFDLPRFRPGGAVHGPAKGTSRLTTAPAEIGDLLRAGEKLDRFRPHRMTVAERRPAVNAVPHFGMVAHVRERAELARRLHTRLRFPPGAAPSPFHAADSGGSARTGLVSLPHSSI